MGVDISRTFHTVNKFEPRSLQLTGGQASGNIPFPRTHQRWGCGPGLNVRNLGDASAHGSSDGLTLVQYTQSLYRPSERQGVSGSIPEGTADGVLFRLGGPQYRSPRPCSRSPQGGSIAESQYAVSICWAKVGNKYFLWMSKPRAKVHQLNSEWGLLCQYAGWRLATRVSRNDMIGGNKNEDINPASKPRG